MISWEGIKLAGVRHSYGVRGHSTAVLELMCVSDYIYGMSVLVVRFKIVNFWRKAIGANPPRIPPKTHITDRGQPFFPWSLRFAREVVRHSCSII